MQDAPCFPQEWTLCKKYNRKEIVAKISPKIIPKIVQKPSLKSSQISLQQSPLNCQNKCKFYPLKMCVYNYKYKRQCMLECRKYGVVSKMKTTSLLPICIKSNGMWNEKLFNNVNITYYATGFQTNKIQSTGNFSCKQ